MSCTDASPKRGDSATLHFLDDPSPLDFSGEHKTISFPFKVQVFCPQMHSRQDHCHRSSGHKHSWPFNTQSSQGSSRLSDLERYQWNKFDTYSPLHKYPSISTTLPV